jgi:ATPase subunit of ABC transporter with duplicated ATPase domains
MQHSPITLQNVSLYFSYKLCFSNFSTTIYYGQRIGIIGKNGSGKSTLLKIIQNSQNPTSGSVNIPANVTFGYVPQIIGDFAELSGGQKLQKALSQALALNPNVLCLDEPTNHLDASNKRSLINMLQHFKGTLIIITHDVELLESVIDYIWHIEENKITIYSGSYQSYLKEQKSSWAARLKNLEQLKKERKKAIAAIELEKKRAAQSIKANRKENDRNIIELMKEDGSRSAGTKSRTLNKLQDTIAQNVQDARMPEVLKPKFHLNAKDLTSHKALISISEGNCGYDAPILKDIYLQLMPTEHAALSGDNGSGKSTLLKAFLGDPNITKSGSWTFPKRSDIGYLDQHYSNLNSNDTVMNVIERVAPQWKDAEIRKHLNDFLFRKNEEVNAQVSTLSGGEKARLSLAQIAAQSPRLLLLDEITNNIDLETREHIIEVLKEYPGAMLIISHDRDFLESIGIDSYYTIKNETLVSD